MTNDDSNGAGSWNDNQYGNNDWSSLSQNSSGSSWGDSGSSGHSSKTEDPIIANITQKPQKSVLLVAVLIASILSLPASILPIFGLIVSVLVFILAVITCFRAFGKKIGSKTVSVVALLFSLTSSIIAIVITAAAFLAFTATEKATGIDLKQIASDMTSADPKKQFIENMSGARISYQKTTGKEAPYTEEDIKNIAENTDAGSLTHLSILSSTIIHGNLSKDMMEDRMMVLNTFLKGGSISYNKKYEKKSNASINIGTDGTVINSSSDTTTESESLTFEKTDEKIEDTESESP